MPEEDITTLIKQGSLLARIIDLRIAQENGDLPPPGEISLDDLATALNMPKSTVQNTITIGLAKCAKLLSQDPDLALYFSTTNNDHA